MSNIESCRILLFLCIARPERGFISVCLALSSPPPPPSPSPSSFSSCPWEPLFSSSLLFSPRRASTLPRLSPFTNTRTLSFSLSTAASLSRFPAQSQAGLALAASIVYHSLIILITQSISVPGSSPVRPYEPAIHSIRAPPSPPSVQLASIESHPRPAI